MSFEFIKQVLQLNYTHKWFPLYPRILFCLEYFKVISVVNPYILNPTKLQEELSLSG